MCATFGSGIPSACVVDVGDEKTSICCVEDGVSITNTRYSEFLPSLLSDQLCIKVYIVAVYVNQGNYRKGEFYIIREIQNERILFSKAPSELWRK